jgi:hypothetical protein
MSVATELTGTSKLRRLTAVCAGAITLAASLSANAAFVISAGGTTEALPISGNDFNGDLSGEGIQNMTTGAQLSVDMDGFVTFYYLAAESGYTNSFNSGPNTITEHNEGFKWDGWSSFTISVAANEILDFSFTSATAHALTPVDNASGTSLEGLGIMTDGNMSDLVLAYNDNALGTGDADYDDMLVRAEFSAVPIPAAVWLFGSGLLGLIGIGRRRKL